MAIDIFRMPSPRRFLDTIIDDLVDRRNTLVLMPVGVDPADVWPALRSELWQRDLAFEEVSLPEYSEQRSPVSVLDDYFELTWPSLETPRTIARLINQLNAAYEGQLEIIRLEGLDELSDPARERWIDFFQQWARASHSMADRGHIPPALCLVIRGTSLPHDVPTSDIHLAVHWWWRFPSILEMHLLCRLGNQAPSWDTETRWREHVLPTLAGTDPGLVEFLWDDLHLNLEELTGHLHSFAQQRGWNEEILREWGAEKLISLTNREYRHETYAPPKQWHALWANGALIWTPEYGLELHTAALAILGRNTMVGHRLWRGQARLLLPLVDHVRLLLCEHLTGLYGYDWPTRWMLPMSQEEILAVRKDPFACQWGHLERLLKDCPDLDSESYWLPLASSARRIRNEIAHYRPISYAEFDTLYRKIEEVTISANLALSV